ncbi:MAG: T9SS type A sorting domain-containing protein, partial [Calditrichaeota bacterium]|nr:T9SS type A sorting domain-containing protein [Calditrichota bacterium]
ALSANYPNPFNPSTTIAYQLPQSVPVTLTVYNLLGQRVRRLVQGVLPPGYYQAVWNGRNDAGVAVGSGIYIYRFEAGDYRQVRKMILLK